MMDLVDRIADVDVIRKVARRFRERGIVLPTFAEQRDPGLIAPRIRERLARTGLWDLDPVNLFRIGWRNAPVERGGGFGPVNAVEVPHEITGVAAPIVLLAGKYFPTGSHKVGAAYGCLAPRIVTGTFDPTRQKAVWPSTGNFCRGGAFDSHIMGCTAVAILPEGMSRERFEWLRGIGAEVITTPGGEANVKEIYDKCREIRRNDPDAVIFNQFEELGNAAWHYAVTGRAVEQAFEDLERPGDRPGLRPAAWVCATGSAGTIAAGDYLKRVFPRLRVVAVEAQQCPTLTAAGHGEHRIEGIGDKHVPWIHNVRTTDVVAAIDDEECLRVFRLFNEPQGRRILQGLCAGPMPDLGLLGISGVANVLAAVKAARAFELTERDVVFTVATDSADLYRSRLAEMSEARGAYTMGQAERDLDRCLHGQRDDHLEELTYAGRKRIHNLKYFTWVEQQGRSVEDLDSLWYDEDLWDRIFDLPAAWDGLIREFNALAGAEA